MADTLLLLPGSAGAAALWDRYVDPLAGLGYRVVVPELTGDERPSLGQGGSRLESQTELISRFLPRSGGRFHLVGYSYGGAIALTLATKSPPGLASLTLIEPAAFFVLRYTGEVGAYIEVVRALNAFLTELDRGRMESAMRVFLRYWTGLDAWDGLPRRARDEALVSAGKIRLDWEAALEADPGIDALLSIKPRTLLVYGAMSPFPSRRVTTALARILPNTTLVGVEDAGHLLPLTHGSLLTRALLAHLQSVGEAPPPNQ